MICISRELALVLVWGVAVAVVSFMIGYVRGSSKR